MRTRCPDCRRNYNINYNILIPNGKTVKCGFCDCSWFIPVANKVIDLNVTHEAKDSKNDEVVIKHALDAGADGIIVPMIKSEEDARMAVQYAKYPPIGKRGVGLSRAQNYGNNFHEYKKWVNDGLIIVGQIEHIDGVNNLEDIISVDELDGIIIGPYDLSGSLGFPGEFDREIVNKALDKVKQICLEAEFSLGFHVVQPDVDLAKCKINEGYNFIAFSTDFYFMGETAIEATKALRDV